MLELTTRGRPAFDNALELSILISCLVYVRREMPDERRATASASASAAWDPGRPIVSLSSATPRAICWGPLVKFIDFAGFCELFILVPFLGVSCLAWRMLFQIAMKIFNY